MQMLYNSDHFVVVAFEVPTAEGEAAPAENERAPALAPGKKAKRELPPYLRVIK